MTLKTIRDLHPKNKKVLVRVDYNVPIEDGEVGDLLRIQSSLKTIHYLLDHGCSLILMSHLGRPEGKPNKDFSLAPVSKKAGEMIGREVTFVPEAIGPQAEAAAKALQKGEIMMLENLRFYPEEEANDAKFAERLAGLAEVYIDDAFANAHRDHASMTGVTKYLPSAAGFLVENEVAVITGALHHSHRPRVAIVGGAKVSTKLDVLENLMKHVDKIAIGGAMANTFLKAQGHNIGKSKFEPELLEEALRIIKDCAEKKVELVLPEDVIVAKSVKKGPGHHVNLQDVKDDDFIVDVGSTTVAHILNPLGFHGTIIWNGPLGITEVDDFNHGSRLLAGNIIDSGADCIVGGGDTAAFVDEEGLHDKFMWVSTGGGASMELMAGQELPALAVLKK